MSQAPPAREAGGPLLVVEHLAKRYRTLWALKRVSFEVRPGEILGLIGPNGSGKTTLFNCLAGVTTANGGTVSAGAASLDPRARKDFLFYVPDGVHPWSDQTVGRILEFIAGMYGSEDRRRDVVRELGLRLFLPAPAGTLSKGEHRRLLLAIGLLTDQPLLMLDEPFDGLDLRQARETMRVLRAHAAAGRTLFLSIHQLNDAALVCDRLVLLSGGRVVGEGTLDELRERAGLGAGGLEEVFLALT